VCEVPLISLIVHDLASGKMLVDYSQSLPRNRNQVGPTEADEPGTNPTKTGAKRTFSGASPEWEFHPERSEPKKPTNKETHKTTKNKRKMTILHEKC
jgi:hypothetical protein